MKTNTVKSDILMLVASAIWGFAFVAQRIGMDYVGPFIYNGIRFALGSLILLPYVLIKRKNLSGKRPVKSYLPGCIITGVVVFCGATLQQIGIIYTSAGKAGFITGLYVILVPIFGIFLHKKTHTGTWIGGLLAIIGLFLLSVKGDFTISAGDLLILGSAVFWAFHLYLVDEMTSKISAIFLAFIQFAICSIFSLVCAFLFETTSVKSIFDAAMPILYGGLLSVGIAYTLQVIAQKKAHPAHAAIILSLEGVFAVIGGIIILNESLEFKGLAGCFLMLAGMLASQMKGIFFKKDRIKS